MRKYQIIIATLLVVSVVADVKLVTQEFTAKNFDSSAVSGWQVTGNKNNNLVSNCGDQSVFGGYDTFGARASASKDYNSGVDHFELTFNFDLYTIDSWDNEVFNLYVDDQLVYSLQALYNQPSPKPINGTCGQVGMLDRLQSVTVKLNHYRKQFNVRLTTTLDQDPSDESWAIKNFQILARYGGGNIQLISEEYNQDSFQSDASTWNIVNVQPVFTKCGDGTKIFGGYNAMGKDSLVSKTYNNLPPHYGVLFAFDLWLIDSPEGNDYVQVIVDGQIQRFYRPDYQYEDLQNFICGVQGWSERIIKVNLFVPHRGPSINIAFRGVFDEGKDNESFGFRNLRIVSLGCSSARCQQVSNEFYQQTFADPQGWTDEGGNTLVSPFKTCSQATLFGPFSVPIEKTYDSLQPHSGVRIFLRVFALGDWTNSQTGMKFFVNDVLTTPKVAAEFAKNKICDADTESVRNYFIDIPHSNSILELDIKPVNFVGSTKYSIRDLSLTAYFEEGQTLVSSEFTSVNFNSAAGWTINGNTNSVTTSRCGKYSLFGGFNAFGRRTSASKLYNSLPDHDYVVIVFTVYLIDTWERENFNIAVDDVIIKRITKSETWNGHQHLCGRGDSMEETYTFQLNVPHTASTVKLTFSDELDQTTDDESWGIRDLSILVGKNQGAGFVSQDDTNCIQIYTQCNYDGLSLAVCNNIPDLGTIGWTKPIKSIKIPQGKSIQAYKLPNYQGDSKQFTSSQDCLTGQNYLLINKAFNIDVEPETKLKHQRRI
ncbi:granule tip protein (macronuclear) [Tetrahymena thermophila SB210]|uniref:Granule tip protein n=2 Tax=Tetrahymena thermophila TaxID=5911 RepID=I7MKW5_TETTS|nr:granule tip protein [Tetrahymena thermophila SB210]ABC75092.1 granule tip protein 2 [Tetrahymena thermophila]EAS00440.2 granule tip protein [Tetrahymena thermophila SB210]|eukprot:XP_001020685.2 granule tip protein [Tetrahymena thermophila SB210]